MAIVVPPRGTRGSEFPAFARAFIRVMQGPFQMVFRRFGDRMRVQGRPLIELETVGAKTGTRRHVVLGSFPELAPSPSTWVVVASNSGSARHPAWFLNLAKHPDQVWIGERHTPGQSHAGDPRGHRARSNVAPGHIAFARLWSIRDAHRPHHSDRSTHRRERRAVNAPRTSPS
jgi:deazaflavin-dependent oxidoreductase (nitroreductase family)